MTNTIPTPHDEMVASSIIPPHDAREADKLESLVESMSLHGWQGRPILIAEYCDTYCALTGTHRLAAAEQAGIDVPVVITTVDDWAEWHATRRDDEDRLNYLTEIDDTDAITLMQAEIDANA